MWWARGLGIWGLGAPGIQSAVGLGGQGFGVSDFEPSNSKDCS